MAWFLKEPYHVCLEVELGVALGGIPNCSFYFMSSCHHWSSSKQRDISTSNQAVDVRKSLLVIRPC